MRVEGRRKGNRYEIVQGDVVSASYSLREAVDDQKLAAAIKRNKWQPVLSPGEVIDGD